MIRIGSYEIPSKILLAPMAGCTDLSFRLIAREHGAKFCFFEMVDCNSITYGAKRKVRSILRSYDADQPIAAQLLGRDPDTMLRGAKEILNLAKISFLDINAACPAKKVVKKRAGAYLLNDESELCNILKTLSGALDVPVTVKIRIGYMEPDAKKIASLAKKCEKSGAAAIFVHGRTKAQGYLGGVDYGSIKAIKESVGIPVFGNGNIFDAESAKEMFELTGCDGILAARGALGNPWIFREIEEYLKTGVLPAVIDLQTRKDILKKHLSYIVKYDDRGGENRVGFMRKVAIWYLKSFPMAPSARQKVSLVKSYDKMIELIDSL